MDYPGLRHGDCGTLGDLVMTRDEKYVLVQLLTRQWIGDFAGNSRKIAFSRLVQKGFVSVTRSNNRARGGSRNYNKIQLTESGLRMATQVVQTVKRPVRPSWSRQNNQRKTSHSIYGPLDLYGCNPF